MKKLIPLPRQTSTHKLQGLSTASGRLASTFDGISVKSSSASPNPKGISLLPTVTNSRLRERQRSLKKCSLTNPRKGRGTEDAIMDMANTMLRSVRNKLPWPLPKTSQRGRNRWLIRYQQMTKSRPTSAPYGEKPKR